MVLEELAHFSGKEDYAVPLLLIAGVVREEMPWLSEVLVQLYREAASQNIEGVIRLRRSMRSILRGPFIEEMMGGSKRSHFLAMELPMIVDRAIGRCVDHLEGNLYRSDKSEPEN